MKSFKKFPLAIPLKKLLGPSFIILALGLGSGEVILWPYLTSNYGLGIVWGALLGITLQFFINMEIERYALVKGESVFVGLSKLFRWTPYWFIFSTFIGFGLPGIIAASAKVFGSILGIQNFKWIAIGLLIFIGIVLSIGKTVYKLMETVTRTIIFIGIPFIFLLAIYISTPSDWFGLGKGILGRGEGYAFWPIGMSIATFFAAFAYSGAGGNLNLTQSIYIKEKGYGMGIYAQKIAGLFKNIKGEQKIKLEGEEFEINEENIRNFKTWWKRINLEHLFIFWFLGIVAMSLLMLLSYITTFGFESNVEGINFVLNEGAIISKVTGGVIAIIFLAVVAIMLFQTELGILDSTSRIMAENYALKKMAIQKSKTINLSKIYYIFLWAQIFFGIILFLLNIYEPKTLIVLGAIINAFAMFVHIGLVTYLNYKSLPKVFQPKVVRRLVVSFAFIIFGIFSIITIHDTIFK